MKQILSKIRVWLLEDKIYIRKSEFAKRTVQIPYLNKLRDSYYQSDYGWKKNQRRIIKNEGRIAELNAQILFFEKKIEKINQEALRKTKSKILI